MLRSAVGRVKPRPCLSSKFSLGQGVEFRSAVQSDILFEPRAAVANPTEAAVPVETTVQAREFLIPLLNSDRVDKRFTKPGMHHGVEKPSGSEIISLRAWARV